MANVYTGTSNTVPSILVGSSSPVTALGYTPTLIDVYTVEMISNIAELDGDITNDTVYATYAVTDSTYARDNGVITNLLGVGVGATALIGQNFELVAMDTMTTVSFFVAPGAPGLGDSVSVSIYNTAGGIPTTEIGLSDMYLLTTADTVAAGAFLTLGVTDLFSNPLILPTGTYYIAANEYNTVDNMALGFTSAIFTPNTAWISINGGVFATSEGLGFPGAYVIRPNFGPYVCSPTGSTVLDAACNTYTWAQNGSTYTASGMYNDTLVNAEGCDSIVTLDLTINGPTTSTQTEASCSDYVWIVDGQTYIMTGMYTAVIPNAAGCDSTITLDLTIGMLDISTTVNGSTITSNAGGSATYQWVDCDNGNAPIAGATNQSYTATVSGNYAVVIVDGTCNAASVCEPVCVGTASNATEAACFSYVWALDGNTYTTAGQYTAVLANAAGCDSTVTLDLTINTVDNTTSVAGNTFTANLAGGTYLWIDCVTNNTIATETNQSFTPTTPGDYAVIVSDGTCSDTSDCVTSTVGLNENTLSKGFEIFPNPTKGAFTIAISGIVTDKVTVIITEARGKVIMTQEFTNVSESMELPVHLNSMEAGVYFVTITANDSKSVQRIVVTK
ncbi:MAG: T9SS type A sorting domain-containing protein [Crocinitomicaceae bacterium]